MVGGAWVAGLGWSHTSLRTTTRHHVGRLHVARHVEHARAPGPYIGEYTGTVSSRAPEDSSRPLRPAVKLANVVCSKCCRLCTSPTAESPASLVVRRVLSFGDHQANTCIGRPRPLGHGGNAGSVGETSVSIGHRHDTLLVASVHDPHAMAPAEIADRILVVIPTRPKATLCALAGKGV